MAVIKNPIKRLAHNLNDAILAEGVIEIIKWHDTAILKSNGVVRKVGDEVAKLTNSHGNKLRMAEDIILKEAATRFVQLWWNK